MAVTARQVYELALVLMDEVQENGSIAPDQPDYYEAKSLSILTLLQAELQPISQIVPTITSMEQNLSVPDKTALTVLPYGLGAHLLMSEDMSVASFLNSRYEELKRRTPTTITKVQDVYGLFGGAE